MTKTVLSVLEEKNNDFISGEIIGETLHMTRANVWKEIQKLKEMGYEIESIRNKGYRLVSAANNLSESQIKSLLNQNTVEHLEVLREVDSTNDYAKAIANSTNVENYCVVSEYQTKGKGRKGRSFHSPSKQGVYLSLILKPKFELEEAQMTTIIAALACVDALQSQFGLRTDIKWLNDIYMSNKKLAGILTEGEVILESHAYKYLVVGIGINIFADPQLPNDLKNIYTSLDEHVSTEINRDFFVANVLNHFYKYYNHFPENKDEIIKRYKEHCFVLGQHVLINDDSNKRYLATDISPKGHLIVKDETGETLTLNSGEISIGGFKNEN